MVLFIITNITVVITRYFWCWKQIDILNIVLSYPMWHSNRHPLISYMGVVMKGMTDSDGLLRFRVY